MPFNDLLGDGKSQSGTIRLGGIKWFKNSGAGFRIDPFPAVTKFYLAHIRRLIRRAKREADIVITSIFVNPTQFAPNEDFARYPRNFERDCALMESVPVDIVFAPEINEYEGRRSVQLKLQDVQPSEEGGA